jgi:hypothetical protein
MVVGNVALRFESWLFEAGGFWSWLLCLMDVDVQRDMMGVYLFVHPPWL